MSGEFEHRNLGMLLLQARESVMGLFRPVLKQFSLTEQQWRIIRELNESEHGEMEIGQIARECCILSPSLSGMLERMEQSGLIQRHRDALDQRKVRVSLTPSSRQLVKQISPLVDARYREIEARIGKQALAQVYEMLDGITASLPRPEPEAPAPGSRAARAGRSAGAAAQPKSSN